MLGYFCTRAPFAQLQRTLEQLGLARFEAWSKDDVLSTDPTHPSHFDSSQEMKFPKGTMLYDIPRRSEQELPFDLICKVDTTARGFFEERVFKGEFQVQTIFLRTELPTQSSRGEFHVNLA